MKKRQFLPFHCRFIAALERKSAVFCLFTACLKISIVLAKLQPPYFSFELLAFIPVEAKARRGFFMFHRYYILLGVGYSLLIEQVL
ncbi:hypothetical protein [Candidatus Avelusimicrobium fimicolum]|uniref:hypothetical protein n=1 Tax=Candidatus Avelusimicrobium fimicolum TaxID=3416216 RepID=UPI003D098D05